MRLQQKSSGKKVFPQSQPWGPQHAGEHPFPLYRTSQQSKQSHEGGVHFPHQKLTQRSGHDWPTLIGCLAIYVGCWTITEVEI